MAYIDHVQMNGTRNEIVSKPLSDSIASEFSASTAYAVDDLVMHEGTLYKFTVAHAAGAWNSGHVTAVSLDDEIGALKDALNNLDIETDVTLSISGKPADAKSTGDKIDRITKSSDKTLEYELTTNSYVDKNSGEFKPYSNWKRTNFIDVSDCEYFTVNISSTYCYYYRADQSPLQAVSLYTNQQNSVPDNAAFLVVSESSAKMNTLVITAHYASVLEGMQEDLDFIKATDKTLSIANKAADAQTTGARLDIADSNIQFISTNVSVVTGNSKVTWRPGYITSAAPGNVITPDTTVEDSEYECTVFDVVPKERYVIMGRGGADVKRFLTIVDSENTVTVRSSDNVNADVNPMIYTIPNNSSKMIVNVQKKYYHSAYEDFLIPTRVQTLEADLQELETELHGGMFDLSSAKNIVLLGDSITHGVGSSDFSATGDPLETTVHATYRNVGVKCWAYQFSTLMETEYGCTCVNNGVSQFKIDDLRANLNVLLPSGTDYAIIMLGTNNRSATASTIKTMMTNLLTDVKATGTIPFVLSPIPTRDADVKMGRIQAGVKAACKALNVPFFPLYNEIQYYLFDNEMAITSILSDSLHPNDTGHSIVYQLIRKLLSV